MKKILEFTIYLAPITKKNSQRLLTVKSGETGKKRIIPVPSEQYKRYEKDCAIFMPQLENPITDYVNICARYYLPRKNPTDLTNLNEALHDILADYKVIIDDDNLCVGATDGSRVLYDKENPRTEVEISILEEDKAWDAVSKPKNKNRPVIRENKSVKKEPKKKGKPLPKGLISFDSYLHTKGLTLAIYDTLGKNNKAMLMENYNNLYGENVNG